jgi:hypothetical protein
MKRNENVTYIDRVVELSARSGAVITSAFAMFAGGVALDSAEAAPLAQIPNTPAHIDTLDRINNGDNSLVPKGIHQVTGEEITLEANKTQTMIHERWNGLVVVHAATKEDLPVVFAKSPSSYDFAFPDLDITPHTNKTVHLMQPGIVRAENGRVYLVSLEKDPSEFTYLDLRQYLKAGAISLYEFTDSKPEPVPLNINNPKQTPYANPTVYPRGMRYFTDSAGRIRHVQPSKVVPYVKP